MRLGIGLCKLRCITIRVSSTLIINGMMKSLVCENHLHGQTIYMVINHYMAIQWKLVITKLCRTRKRVCECYISALLYQGFKIKPVTCEKCSLEQVFCYSRVRDNEVILYQSFDSNDLQEHNKTFVMYKQFIIT